MEHGQKLGRNGRRENRVKKVGMGPWGVKQEFGSDIWKGGIKGLSPRQINIGKGKKWWSARRAANETSNTKRIRRGST